MRVDLTEQDLGLISNALDVLQENRQDEIKWSGGDPYITKYAGEEIDAIDDLLGRLSGEPADNRDRVGVPELHIITYCDSDGEHVISYADGYECPYCHATGVRHYCPDCGAKMYYAE